ncbi:uracil phosphoribosyltransferase [Desulfosporosinus sp. FKB]|uniref:uracil phosphoribosyltransferase n=1 Tax=Desulfosporosinus sp. FKB TaxID=1969835 RepID=UPI000B49B307|nr:uracil phosphoribosyltransferase [Desulfosporosinus sp. FKB]
MYKVITNKYASIIETKIRDCNTDKEMLRKSLYELGVMVGQEICLENMSSEVKVHTPMKEEFKGFNIDTSKEYIVISTKDDYAYFANGLSSVIGDCYRGYIDFGGSRGEDVYTSPIRSIDLPDIKTGRPVEFVIIAKSVLATGCTAISLAKKALEKYMPRGIIIASAFYSERGVYELKREIPHAEIYVCTNPDQVDHDGMLIPGVGNLDQRLN